MYAPTAPRRIANWVSEELDRRVGLYLAAFSAVFLILSCMQAATKLMWFDELDTLYHASLPGPGAIYDALKLGADANPPLYPLLTSYFFELWGRSELSVRLGAVLGFWVMTLCLFSFVRRRTGALFGFLAVGFILVSFVYEYAYEGRAYGALFGFTGAALLCWQRAKSTLDCGLGAGAGWGNILPLFRNPDLDSNWRGRIGPEFRAAADRRRSLDRAPSRADANCFLSSADASNASSSGQGLLEPPEAVDDPRYLSDHAQALDCSGIRGARPMGDNGNRTSG
jgi:hypothetical protein